MRPRVDSKQALPAHMSVDLRGLQAGMTQQFLHHSEVRAPVQQMGGEAVAEGVGVGRDRRPAVEDPPDVTGSQAVSPPVVEERRCRAGGGDHRGTGPILSLIHISESTRRTPISYAAF